MSGIWDRVQSILDKLKEEEQARRSGFDRGTSIPIPLAPITSPTPTPQQLADSEFVQRFRPPSGPQSYQDSSIAFYGQSSPVGSQPTGLLQPGSYEAAMRLGQDPASTAATQPQPMGLLQPGGYEAAMATAAQAGQGPVPSSAPRPGRPQIEEIPIKAQHSDELDFLGRAAAVYGETAGLRPQLIDPNKSVNDPKNWDPASAIALHQARTDLAAMYGGPNPHMVPKMPSDPNNPIQKQQWEAAMAAAAASMVVHPDLQLQRMWMRQEGSGDQTYKPWVKEGFSPLQPMGPFVNTIPATPQQIKNGDAIAKGPRAYIDFYGKR